MLIMISKGKGLYKVAIRFVGSSQHSFNLGSHYCNLNMAVQEGGELDFNYVQLKLFENLLTIFQFSCK